MSSTQRVFNGHVSFFMVQYGMWLNLLLIKNNFKVDNRKFRKWLNWSIELNYDLHLSFILWKPQKNDDFNKINPKPHSKSNFRNQNCNFWKIAQSNFLILTAEDEK